MLDDANVVAWFLDPAIQFPEPDARRRTSSRCWSTPPARGRTGPRPRPRIPNLYLASDFVRTHTDLATMEGANEAARRAVNAILERDGLARAALRGLAARGAGDVRARARARQGALEGSSARRPSRRCASPPDGGVEPTGPLAAAMTAAAARLGTAAVTTRHSEERDLERAREIAERGLILRTTVGSVVHGLSNPGTDDRDELGVCIEPPEYLLGFRRFEHFVYRTQPEGCPSGPGDLDLTVYGLRKYCRLALKGSPTTLLPLFVEGEHVLARASWAGSCRRSRPRSGRAPPAARSSATSTRSARA